MSKVTFTVKGDPTCAAMAAILNMVVIVMGDGGIRLETQGAEMEIGPDGKVRAVGWERTS